MERFNELATRLESYDYLSIQVDKIGLTVFNKNHNKILALYRVPFGRMYGHIEDYNTGERKIVTKGGFDRALSHLYRIANEIAGSNAHQA